MWTVFLVTVFALAKRGESVTQVTDQCIGSTDGLHVVLALDCSGSVVHRDWDIARKFAKDFVINLKQAAPTAFIAVVFFDGGSYLKQTFTTNLTAILNALDSPRCSTGTAFPNVVVNLFKNATFATKRTLLLITDGEMSSGIQLASDLKRDGVLIFTVGIGNVTVNQLQAMGSQPPSEFHTILGAFNDLRVLIVGLVSKIVNSAFYFAPTYAPGSGGVPVYVNVPEACLVGSVVVHCRFGDSSALANKKNGSHVCVSPVTSQLGFVKFSVIVSLSNNSNVILDTTGRFEFIDARPIKPEYNTFNTTSDSMEVKWERFPTDLLSKVDIYLYRVENGFWVPHEVALDVENSGSWKGPKNVNILTGYEGKEFVQVRHSAKEFGASTSKPASEGAPYWSGLRERRNLLVKENSPTNFFSHDETPLQENVVIEFLMFLSMSNSEKCQSWYDKEDMGWYDEIKDVACPPNANVASMDPDFSADLACCDSSVAKCLPIVNWFVKCEDFHPSSTHCVRSTPSTPNGPRQQCCYNRQSGGYRLALGPPGGGTADRSSDTFSPFSKGHKEMDVDPWKWCCKDDPLSRDCHNYYKKRPSRDSKGYNKTFPAAVSGDPHFFTLDGFNYTFNGKGEFILMQTKQNTENGHLLVQIRTEKMFNLTGATRTTALAVRYACNSTPSVKDALSVGVYLLNTSYPNSRPYRVLVNQELLNDDGRPRYLYTRPCDGEKVGVVLSEQSVVIQGPGLSMTVSVQYGIMSYMVVVADAFKGSLEGLLGNFNGNKDDDLLPRGSDVALSPASNLSTIHWNFGRSWNIAEAESLFVYLVNARFADINDMTYTPIFETPAVTNATLEQQINELCGQSFACRFDAALTKDLRIGNLSRNMEDLIKELTDNSDVQQVSNEQGIDLNAIMKYLENMNSKISELNRKMTVVTWLNYEMRNMGEEMEKRNKEEFHYWERIVELEMKADYLENRERRNNLLFFGLPEKRRERWNETETFLMRFVKQEMGINLALHDMERIHRVGARMSDRPRPIFVKFSCYRVKRRIFEAARMLRGSRFSIQEDFPSSVREIRRQLVPFMKRARSEGKVAKLQFDKLIVEGRAYGFEKGELMLLDRGAAIDRNRQRSEELSIQQVAKVLAAEPIADYGPDLSSSTPMMRYPNPLNAETGFGKTSPTSN